jgi:hypothetical protein
MNATTPAARFPRILHNVYTLDAARRAAGDGPGGRIQRLGARAVAVLRDTLENARDVQTNTPLGNRMNDWKRLFASYRSALELDASAQFDGGEE